MKNKVAGAAITAAIALTIGAFAIADGESQELTITHEQQRGAETSVNARLEQSSSFPSSFMVQLSAYQNKFDFAEVYCDGQILPPSQVYDPVNQRPCAESGWLIIGHDEYTRASLFSNVQCREWDIYFIAWGESPWALMIPDFDGEFQYTWVGDPYRIFMPVVGR